MEGLRHADEDFISKGPGLIANDTWDFSRDSENSQLILNSLRVFTSSSEPNLHPFFPVKALKVHRGASLTIVLFGFFFVFPSR